MKRISSPAYRDGARGQPCSLRIAGVCTGGGEDTVFAHIRDEHTGGAIKASDISGCDACFACHEVFDRRAKPLWGGLIGERDWIDFALRGLQRTLENRIARGILILPADATETRRTSKRKGPPIANRPMPKSTKTIQSPGFPQGPKRHIQSAPFKSKRAK